MNVRHGSCCAGLLSLLCLVGCAGNGSSSGSPASGDPTAVASVSPPSGTSPLIITFDGTASSDPDGGALTYLWDFGNGDSSTNPAGSATYFSDGIYVVSLTVMDPDGFSDQISMTVVVGGAVPAETFADTVLHLTNLERLAMGLPPLAGQGDLATAAAGHAVDMAIQDFFDHVSLDGRTPFDRITDAGYNFNAAGENIAAGQATPAEVVLAWMSSPGHRANILDPSFRELGVGYFFELGDIFPGPFGFGHYWVQNFGRRDAVFPIVIDNEAFETTDTTVDVYLHDDGWAVDMMLSEDPTFTGAIWEPFQALTTFQLSSSPGLKTIYGRMSDGGATLREANDAIVLQ